MNENEGGGDGDVIAQAAAFTAFPLAAIAFPTSTLAAAILVRCSRESKWSRAQGRLSVCVSGAVICAQIRAD